MILQVEEGAIAILRPKRLGEPSAHRPKGDKSSKKALKINLKFYFPPSFLLKRFKFKHSLNTQDSNPL